MADNLALWNAVETTDPRYTKAFSRGGGFKGTATNATYLIRKATEQFGPLGIGFGWSVIDEKYVEGAPLTDHAREIVHVVRIKLWYIFGEKRGEIEHFGQTQFVGKNKNGVFTDEEAPKKSLTDAISKALSGLGFAADIHLGRYDDNKYVSDLKREFSGQPMDARDDNSEPSVSRYIMAAKETIKSLTSTTDLLAWWKGEADIRGDFFGVAQNDDPQYADLFAAFTARGKELRARETAKETKT